MKKQFLVSRDRELLYIIAIHTVHMDIYNPPSSFQFLEIVVILLLYVTLKAIFSF